MPAPKVIQASTQEHLPVADIAEDIVLLKDGGAAIVLESTSLNFSLLSEKEQDAIIAAYAALLNSLSFPVQILIRSQKKDISNYLAYLEQEEKKQKNPKLAQMMTRYREFISQTVKKKNVLEKRFFLVIPFSSLELGVPQTLFSLIKRQKRLPFPRSFIIKKAKTSLYPKRDHLIRQVSRIGLKLKQLGTNELLELLFEIYNPEESIPAGLSPQATQLIISKKEEGVGGEKTQR